MASSTPGSQRSQGAVLHATLRSSGSTLNLLSSQERKEKEGSARHGTARSQKSEGIYLSIHQPPHHHTSLRAYADRSDRAHARMRARTHYQLRPTPPTIHSPSQIHSINAPAVQTDKRLTYLRQKSVGYRCMTASHSSTVTISHTTPDRPLSDDSTPCRHECTHEPVGRSVRQSVGRSRHGTPSTPIHHSSISLSTAPTHALPHALTRFSPSRKDWTCGGTSGKPCASHSSSEMSGARGGGARGSLQAIVVVVVGGGGWGRGKVNGWMSRQHASCLFLSFASLLINQSINQSIDPSIHPSIDQSTTQSINPPIHPLIQATNQPTNQPIKSNQSKIDGTHPPDVVAPGREPAAGHDVVQPGVQRQPQLRRWRAFSLAYMYASQSASQSASQPVSKREEWSMHVYRTRQLWVCFANNNSPNRTLQQSVQCSIYMTAICLLPALPPFPSFLPSPTHPPASLPTPFLPHPPERRWKRWARCGEAASSWSRSRRSSSSRSFSSL